MSVSPPRQFWLKPKMLWRDPPGRFEPGVVAVQDDRIVATEPPGTPEPGEGWTVVDLSDQYLLPGLINTHVHLEFSASANPLADYLSETPEERLMRALRNAHTLLMSGVTTARDCGSHWSMLALARRPDLSPVPLPRLLCSGAPITVPKGHLHFMDGVVHSPEEILSHIERVLQEGGRSIKVMASGGAMTPGSLPEETVFSQGDLNLIAEEARRRQVPSVSHVLATESIRRSALARFDSLEHCAFFERNEAGRLVRNYDPEVAQVVADSGVSMMANISTATRYFDAVRARGPADATEAHVLRQFDIMVANLSKMADLGIPIVCGSDAGVRETPFDETWLEVVWLIRGGLSPVEALRAATTRAARALLLGGEIGRIAPGFKADLISVREDPLTQHETLAAPQLVMRDGTIVRDPGPSARP